MSDYCWHRYVVFAVTLVKADRLYVSGPVFSRFDGLVSFLRLLHSLSELHFEFIVEHIHTRIFHKKLGIRIPFI